MAHNNRDFDYLVLLSNLKRFDVRMPNNVIYMADSMDIMLDLKPRGIFTIILPGISDNSEIQLDNIWRFLLENLFLKNLHFRN